MAQASNIAQLAHVEMLSPRPQDSVDFFTDILGMQVSGQSGQSVYLRGYQDPYHHSLVITESALPGMDHVAWRTSSAEALEDVAERAENLGLGIEWSESSVGQGKTFVFTNPEGHRHEAVWELEPAPIAPGEESVMPCAVQKRPLQGVPVRRIDHINLLCRDVPANKRFYMNELGFNCYERIVMDGQTEDFGSWLSVTAVPHELALMTDLTGAEARFHHIAFWFGIDQHLYDVAELMRDREVPLEAGPSKHGVTQSTFLYCFEPGGNRVELFGGYGYLILEPDWKERTWTEDLLPVGGSMYGVDLPETYYAYATPPVEIKDEHLSGVYQHAPASLPAS